MNPEVGLTSQIDATGTVPAEPIKDRLSALLARAGDETGQGAASPGEITPASLDAQTDPNYMPLTNYGEMWRDLTGTDASSGGGTRTPYTRIMIPLL